MNIRYLIINADDLGLCPQVDEGILEVVRAGRVSSVSILVNPPFRPLIEPFLEMPVSCGLHLNLTMGFPLSPSGLSSLRAGDGRFTPRWYEEPQEVEAGGLRDEFLRQVEAFQGLVGRLPTHLDTHKHVHIRNKETFEVTAALAKSLNIPLRAQDEAVRATLRDRGILVTDHFVGGVEPSPFWTEERLSATIASLPPGITEMMCHPGRGMPEMEGLRYTRQRDVEREALLAPATGRLLTCIVLASFVTAPLRGIDYGM